MTTLDKVLLAVSLFVSLWLMADFIAWLIKACLVARRRRHNPLFILTDHGYQQQRPFTPAEEKALLEASTDAGPGVIEATWDPEDKAYNEAYQAFVQSMEKHCTCCPNCYERPCPAVLAGGPCDEMPCTCHENQDNDL